MKTRIILVISLFFLVGFTNGTTGGNVTVHGNVYIWNPEHITASAANPIPDDAVHNIDWETWPGGSYIPARQMLTEVEFFGFNKDIKTRTNDNGWYEVTKSNPWWGSYSVDIEMLASAFLDNDDDGDPIVVDTYEDHTDVFQYNGQTKKSSVGKNGTLTIDVYIGGPQNNIDEWWNDSKYKTITAFYMTQMVQDVHRWTVARDPSTGEITRDTYLIYPDGDSDSYNFSFSLPGRGVISLSGSKNLFPSDLKDFIQREAALPLENNYRELRGTIYHEFAHKIMADVYMILPPNWTRESHGIDKCVHRDLAFVEGFAEFFSAAAMNRATINGTMPGSNIEYAYHVNEDVLGNVADEGDISWRDDLNCRGTNEGENAAVLWDIYDPQGWEYMNEPEQDAKPSYWPAALQWFDTLEDQDLEKIWTIIRDHNPDCMMDEDDIIWQDSFWYYWLDQYESVSPNSIMTHGLKAILYNRGISSTQYPENAPENLQVLSVDEANNTATIQVTEKDSEDKNMLRYNIGFALNPIEGLQLFNSEDQLLSLANAVWSGDSITVTVPIPPRAQWNTLAFMVHDNMQTVFTTYGDAIEANCTNPGLTLVSKYKPLANDFGRITISGNDVYLPARTDGVYILDKLKLQSHIPYNTNATEALLAQINTAGTFSAMSVAVDGSTVFLTDGQGELRSYDLSTKTAPRLLDSFSQRYDGSMRSNITDTYGLLLDGQTIYMAGGYNGLYLLDVSNPAEISLIDNYIPQTRYITPTPYEENVLDVKLMQVGTDQMAFLATNNTGLYGVYVDPSSSNMYHTVWSRYLKIEGGSYRLDIENNKAYIADGDGGLRIVDLSGDTMTELGALDTLGNVQSVMVEGNYAYIASDDGVYVVNVSNPSNPRKTCSFENTGPVQDIVFADNYLYVTSPNGGLIVIRVQSNP